MKKDYLCVDDYGSGGIWYLISAESPETIQKTLPFLTVIDTQPEWLIDTEYKKLEQNSRFDIDHLPTEGLLGLGLRWRIARFKGEPPPMSNEEAAKLINEGLEKLRTKKD